MIVFLTLCYCGVLYLLVRLGVIRLTLWWKLSPGAWMILLMILLFIPMQWGAPQGAVMLYRTVVEIVPNVAGEVLEVPARGLDDLAKGDVLFQIDKRPYAYALDRARADLQVAQAEQKLAKLELGRNLQAVKTSAVAQSAVDEWRARLASAEGRIASIESQIADAKYNLEQTTVVAPADGYVIGLTLRPGQRVSTAPIRGWMAFVDEGHTYVVAGVQQYALRHVEPGQPAEVVFTVRPGRTYAAKVRKIAAFGSQGQLVPSGDVPDAPTGTEMPARFGVILDIEGGPELLRDLPAGAVGTAAIYTSSSKPTHVIRRVMVRMQTFLNFVIPG